MKITLGNIQQLLEAIYSEIGEPAFGRYAFRLLYPYLLQPAFGQSLAEAMLEQPLPLVHSRVAAVDLLLEAHGLSLFDPNPPSGPSDIAPTTTLLDVLQKRTEYLPVTVNRSFFIFGRRIDHGLSLQSYREAMYHLTGGGYCEELETEVAQLQARRIILDLVLCAIDHLSYQST